MPGNQGYFWCGRHLSHLHLPWLEVESLSLVCPIVCIVGAGLQRGWGGGQERARWDPIWTDLASCQLSPQWLGTQRSHQKPSKGACPLAHPEWAASSASPLPHYWQKEAKTRELLHLPASQISSVPTKWRRASGSVAELLIECWALNSTGWCSAELFFSTPLDFVLCEQAICFPSRLSLTKTALTSHSQSKEASPQSHPTHWEINVTYRRCNNSHHTRTMHTSIILPFLHLTGVCCSQFQCTEAGRQRNRQICSPSQHTLPPF